MPPFRLWLQRSKVEINCLWKSSRFPFHASLAQLLRLAYLCKASFDHSKSHRLRRRESKKKISFRRFLLLLYVCCTFIPELSWAELSLGKVPIRLYCIRLHLQLLSRSRSSPHVFVRTCCPKLTDSLTRCCWFRPLNGDRPTGRPREKERKKDRTCILGVTELRTILVRKLS